MQRVNAESSDRKILQAIDEAGNRRLPWRKYDWPQMGDEDKSWVIPNDIGKSTGKDTKLLRRLRRLVEKGKLEETYVGMRRVVHRFNRREVVRFIRGMPRFRVVRRR